MKEQNKTGSRRWKKMKQEGKNKKNHAGKEMESKKKEYKEKY